MKNKLKISIVYSEFDDGTATTESDAYKRIKRYVEGFGAEVIGYSAGELNQADGLMCAIEDNTYEEVRKSLNYALDKEKPVSYYLNDKVTLDGGMRLQLGLATNLGEPSENWQRLGHWIAGLETARRKHNKKRKIVLTSIALFALLLILLIIVLRPGADDISPKVNAETVAEEKTENAVTTEKSETEMPYIEDLEYTTSLDLSGKSLTDISFLEKGINLEELNLSDNKITDISVLAKLTKLKKLDISNNEITDINILLALPELTEVDISGNPIEDDTVLEYMKNVEWKE